MNEPERTERRTSGRCDDAERTVHTRDNESVSHLGPGGCTTARHMPRCSTDRRVVSGRLDRRRSGACVPPPKPGNLRFHLPPRVRLGDSRFHSMLELIGTLLYERKLALRNVECDSPPPTAADDEISLAWVVELPDGPLPRLAARYPRMLAWHLALPVLFTVIAEAAGRFAGADTNVVVLDGTPRSLHSCSATRA